MWRTVVSVVAASLRRVRPPAQPNAQRPSTTRTTRLRPTRHALAASEAALAGARQLLATCQYADTVVHHPLSGARSGLIRTRNMDKLGSLGSRGFVMQSMRRNDPDRKRIIVQRRQPFLNKYSCQQIFLPTLLFLCTLAPLRDDPLSDRGATKPASTNSTFSTGQSKTAQYTHLAYVSKARTGVSSNKTCGE